LLISFTDKENQVMTHSEIKSIEFAAYIGLDWADQKHDICLQQAGSNRIESLQLDHKPDSISNWVSQLQQRFQGQHIAIALEQKRGGLLYSLMHYEFIVLYTVNPKALASYRQAFATSGAKDDPVDAGLLLEMVRLHRDKLRPWTPDDPLTRELSLLVEYRRRLVDDRTCLTNRLQALLKQYFPQALDWAGELGSLLAIDFLTRWPQLEALKKASPQEVRDFYRSHGSRLGEKLPTRLAEIRAAQPLTSDQAVVSASSTMVQALLEPLRGLIAGIESLDQQINACYELHPDKEVFDSLPGAGPVLAPRLLAAFGADRGRYPSAGDIQCFSGIAPVTERSGKTKFVRRRLACPKFVRQSFHEFANSSIKWSRWARAYYDQQRHRGNKHHEAIRALAYKWTRIIYRCWQDHEPYDEAIYIAKLELRGSPLAKLISAEAESTVHS
jgi:transposase